MPPPAQLTPQERLAISRKALIKHMNRHRRANEHPGEEQPEAGAEALPPAAPGNTWSLIKQATRTWWHRHPASMAAELARPLLDDYAQAHPFKLLGISAGAGAAIVVIRPWRMVSLGMLLATLRSSGLTSALLSSVLHTSHTPPPQPPAGP